MSSPITAPINLPLIHRGKVRDIFAVDESHMLIVTTDSYFVSLLVLILLLVLLPPGHFNKYKMYIVCF